MTIIFNQRPSVNDVDYDIDFHIGTKDGRFVVEKFRVKEGGDASKFMDKIIHEVESEINDSFPQAAFIRRLADFLEAEKASIHLSGHGGVGARIDKGSLFFITHFSGVSPYGLREEADAIERGDR